MLACHAMCMCVCMCSLHCYGVDVHVWLCMRCDVFYVDVHVCVCDRDMSVWVCMYVHVIMMWRVWIHRVCMCVCALCVC